MSTTVAEVLVRTLVQAGVTHIYGLVGDSLNAFSDAVRRSGGSAKGGLDWIHVHNEEAAAFAASAEAQLTGKLAVCAGSCGPGNTHLIQGVMDAHRSAAPVLVLASHITSKEIGTGFFQETDPKALFAQASHWCELVSTPEQMPRLARVAVQNAVGACGAAVLVLPGDVLAADAVNEVVDSAPAARRPLTAPDPAAVTELAQRLNDAEKVAIFGGIGCLDARDDVLALAAALNAPVGHSLRGKDVLQYDNPYDVGMTGLLGYGACYESLHEADLVLMLGTDFPYTDFLPQAHTVQVDIDPTRLGRRTPLVQGVAADVGLTIEALLPQLTARDDRSFLDDMLKSHDKKVRRSVDTYVDDEHQPTPIHPEYLATILDELADDDAVFTADTGMCCTWIARYISPNGRRKLLGSWVHGSMANALPMAVGAQVAYPQRQVISMSGDGGIAMLLGELLTVKQHRLPTKVVVFNNSSLGMVRLEMLVAGDPPFETDHDEVDYAAIAAGAGFFTRRVTDPRDLRAAVTEVLAHDGPALLDVVTTADALEVPSHLTLAEAKGFALSMGKIVLGGGVGDVLKLAKTNLKNIPRP
ncbi:thiamine pyrophosphate-dependent enzyme [Nakamurella deserti]|uniref:thiamine pyrophosphate-dependent enzyme n=1 Tax=Nakamurella deserti TaxID=2164074 RepID=UPI000DBE2719|nr:thiamine pyrophosphate-dependent enzyme [Nakamurella deserti]